MKIEHKIGIPTAYFEIVAGECFWYQGDLYFRCESGAFSLSSGDRSKGLTDATPVNRVNVKIVIE